MERYWPDLMSLHPDFEDKSVSTHLPSWRRHWAVPSPPVLYFARNCFLLFCHPVSRHLPLETSKPQYVLVTQGRSFSNASIHALTRFHFSFPFPEVMVILQGWYCSSEDVFLRFPLTEKPITLRAHKIRALKITVLLTYHLMSTRWGCGKVC